LVIVHAIDPGRLRLPGGRFRERVDQAHSARQRDASVLIERVRAAGVEPQLLMWDGDPATCVLDAAKAEGASRIVVGSHGRGRLGRAIIGSVSSMIAGQADCPVDIVRGNDATEEIVTVAPVLRRI
jgi:nucleotide-binding universal stress UspA family protein